MTEVTYRQPAPREIERAIAVIDNASGADAVTLMAAACHAAWKRRVLEHVAEQVADEDEAASKAVWCAFEEVQ